MFFCLGQCSTYLYSSLSWTGLKYSVQILKQYIATDCFLQFHTRNKFWAIVAVPAVASVVLSFQYGMMVWWVIFTCIPFISELAVFDWTLPGDHEPTSSQLADTTYCVSMNSVWDCGSIMAVYFCCCRHVTRDGRPTSGWSSTYKTCRSLRARCWTAMSGATPASNLLLTNISSCGRWDRTLRYLT